MNYKKITLDTERKSFESIVAMQGDNKSRYIKATIVNKSIPLDLTGCAVKFSAIKPDMTDIFNDAVITNATLGEVEIELTNQTLAVPGVIQATLVILKEDMQLSVLPFFITVIENPYNSNAIESKSEYKALNNALTTAEGYAKELQDASVNLEEKYTTRLNNFDEQLDKTVRKGEGGSVTWAMASQDFRENVTGGNTAVVGKDTILSENIVNEQIRYEHTNFLTYYENILNPAPKSTGTYWWYVDGTLTEKASVNFNCHNKVLLRKGVTYFIGDVYGLASIVTKLDGNTKITSLSSVDGVFAGVYTPTEDCYLYPTLYKISDATKSVVQNSSTKFPIGDNIYLYYGNKYNITVEGVDLSSLKDDINQIKSDLYKTGNIITVKKDGTGDFTNIVDAIKSVTNSSYTNQYNIYIYDDEPNIYQFMDSTTLDNKGIWLPDGVNIIGIDGQKTINCELPDSETDFRLQNVSTLNLKHNNNLENLIVTGKNVRYPVHDESSNAIKDWKRNVKNCTFEHLGSPSGKWTSLTAWGEGCSSGSESIFENCIFITNSVTGAYGCHNNINFTKPSKHKFISCRFLNKNTSGYSVKFGSMGSTQTDEVEFINCRFTGKIYSGEELSNGCGLDFKIYGSGNDHELCDFDSNLNKNKTIDFIGETITCLNNTGSAIAKGTLVKTASYLSVTPMTSTDSIGLFYGVAIEDIASGSFGLIKQKGYIEKGSLVANDGDKVGISNGNLSVVSSGDYIGKVVRGFIKLL